MINQGSRKNLAKPESYSGLDDDIHHMIDDKLDSYDTNNAEDRLRAILILGEIRHYCYNMIITIQKKDEKRPQNVKVQADKPY